ncbi:5-(carboxyamino)imidazole ribonucleotide synthase [Dokdonia sp. Hel_I_53]|uniref:5-(carboxyamino)imidazole ribonucleotide synthase n=1 Tax=Dokdonia sp. Hel_I_53 TaxID=1566287 RepID=UPI00119C37C8|nr:5-(carboxyamino)imidazole ribonucleotide synthase [Dokdonia sp. Hel_I_53]TVZ53165.1 5-(carboxyamino)imidazole ribonucleotide synthase [Dokdonia sp. Hel_I_53]
MTNYFSSSFKLGILGGGQLGKMMLYDTRKYDIQTYVLDPSEEAPCKIACNHFEQGDLLDYEAVLAFGRKVDILTFEIESVNVDALETLEKEGIKVFPQPAVLRNIQDKGVQKDFYKKHQIPTASYEKYASAKILKNAITEGKSTFDFPFIWKSCKGGYDGKGVTVIRNIEDLDTLPHVPCIAEQMIPFKNELSVIVARNPSGEVETYPVVEMEFHPEANQVEYVICPARISDEVAQKARAVASKVSNAFSHVGLLAVELFQTEDDKILVNEVAPRPHNSGHNTIEASFTSQFEQHLRAILDLPLGNTENKTASVMVNLVGSEGHTGSVTYKNIETIMAMDGVTPHIYGKKETRPFRKMGHVTIINHDLYKAREIASQVKNCIEVITT